MSITTIVDLMNYTEEKIHILTGGQSRLRDCPTVLCIPNSSHPV